jgi:hypothetical protein
MEPETAAFGYLRERLFSEQRVLWQRPLAIRDMRRVVPASGGLVLSKVLIGAFVPKFLIVTPFGRNEEPIRAWRQALIMRTSARYAGQSSPLELANGDTVAGR